MWEKICEGGRVGVVLRVWAEERARVRAWEGGVWNGGGAS